MKARCVEVEQLRKIDASIEEGYAFIMEIEGRKNACDKWLGKG